METRLPLPTRGGATAPILGPCLLWPNGCMDQDATWCGGRPRPRPRCVKWGPISPHQKGAQQPLSQFWPMSIVAKRLDGSRCYLVGLGPGDIVHNLSHYLRSHITTFQTLSSERHFALFSSDFHAVIVLHVSHALHHFTY